MFFKNTKGITLIEIILSIAILSILFLVAVPKGEIVLTFKERKELTGFKRDITYARNKAISDMALCGIKVSPKGNFYSICEGGESLEIIDKKEFESGIEIRGTNFGGGLSYADTIIMFTPKGTPKKAGTIRMRNRKNDEIRITVEPATGKVNLYFNEE